MDVIKRMSGPLRLLLLLLLMMMMMHRRGSILLCAMLNTNITDLLPACQIYLLPP
jgi:hypothetical protein